MHGMILCAHEHLAERYVRSNQNRKLPYTGTKEIRRRYKDPTVTGQMI
jgi:hypothetical protein